MYFEGDDEIVRVWDMSTKKQKQYIQDHGRRWGQITCLAWLMGIETKDGLMPLSFGTGHGLMVIYRQMRENVSSCPWSLLPTS